MVFGYATLGVIGDKSEADRFQQQARRLDHADRLSGVPGRVRSRSQTHACGTRVRLTVDSGGPGITCTEAMAADCTVIAADHPESAASEVLGDAGMLIQPERTALATALGEAIAGKRPTTDPQERATEYDWESVAIQAKTTYEKALQQHTD